MTGSTPGTSRDSLPARSSDVTGQHLPRAGLEPGRPAEELRRGVAGSFQGNTAADGLPGWATLSHLQRGWWEGYFWKISALSGPASSAIFSPSLINALISPQLLLFLEMRFLFLLQGHDPKDPQSLTHLYTLRAPAFLSSFSPHLSDQSHYAFCQGGLWNTRTNVAKATGLKTRLQKQMLYNLGFPSFAFKGSRATASKQAKSLKLKMRDFFFNCHLMSLSS